ncbi:DsrE/DsrF-like family protein [Polystyrenella longa]|uniref:DsrE/DsrF-like family protein n=1 Tax=Polystyrenella longa TaxID=2528007 RepID=A0A518CTN4_9PLAN|nr:DsrE family protein [Polystyrenella longa]QDU82578.1 DsrE/DsrF-like family protein [Polystyrenella longa]
MTSRTNFVTSLTLVLAAIFFVGIVHAQPGPRNGRGAGGGSGGERGQDERHTEDHKVFQFLLTNHQKIKRDVKVLPNGVETLTESDDPVIAAKIKEHVKWMQYRVEETKPIRRRDPLFAELFRHTDKIKMLRVETNKGVRITETSEDAYVVKLIQAHAQTVSSFVENGFEEARKNHPVPLGKASDVLNDSEPVIANYGKVVKLPDALHQPRDGGKIVVDVTKGGKPDELNPAIEKVARFVNIYRGAGKSPAKVEIAIVLHGDATLSVLNTDAYAKRFETKDNPNLDCLNELHKADVKIFVCGQSLIGKGATREEVVSYSNVAVSALTSLVNLQEDGFTYIPLAK